MSSKYTGKFHQERIPKESWQENCSKVLLGKMAMPHDVKFLHRHLEMRGNDFQIHFNRQMSHSICLKAIFSRLQWRKWPSVTSSHCLIIAHNTMDISCATTMSTNNGRLHHQLPIASSQDMFYLDQRRTELPTPSQKCKAETCEYWSLCCKGCSLDGIFTDKENSLIVFFILSSCQQESWTQRTHISSIATRT